SLYFLGWGALVPLLIAIARPGFTAPDVISPNGKILAWTTPLRGFFLGYLSGLIWYAGSCYWVFHVMHRYGKLSTPAALGVLALAAHRRRLLPLALAIAAMLQFGIFLHPAALPAPHSALLVQQNVPLDEEWTPTSLQATFTELAQISALPASSAGDGPRLIV